jgi:hypothetical protein
LLDYALKNEENAREVFDRFYKKYEPRGRVDHDSEFYGRVCKSKATKRRQIITAASGNSIIPCGCGGRVMKIYKDVETEELSLAQCESCKYTSLNDPWWFAIRYLISSGCCDVCCYRDKGIEYTK